MNPTFMSRGRENVYITRVTSKGEKEGEADNDSWQGTLKGRAHSTCSASISELFRAKRHSSENAQAHLYLPPLPLDPAGKKKEKRRATDHVPAVELGRAKNEDPLIRRRVALHDLIRDKRGERSGVEPGQQPDGLRDGRGVCGGIFTRTMQRVALKKENSQ